MRTVHSATSIVAALALAFGVTACGSTEAKPGGLPAITPKATASVAPVPTSPGTPTPAPTGQHQQTPVNVDRSLTDDLYNMGWRQDEYITAHRGSEGVAVAATKPGGTASINTPNDFQASPGNVIAVKVYPAGKGFCISVYNKAATKANSASNSMLDKNNNGGTQKELGAC